jgi:hypothetical protein
MLSAFDGNLPTNYIKLFPFRPKDVGLSVEEQMKASKNIKKFNGIYYRDNKLPKSGKYIVNLDKHTGKGTHWVAVDLHHKIFFDLFG